MVNGGADRGKGKPVEEFPRQDFLTRPLPVSQGFQPHQGIATHNRFQEPNSQGLGFKEGTRREGQPMGLGIPPQSGGSDGRRHNRDSPGCSRHGGGDGNNARFLDQQGIQTVYQGLGREIDFGQFRIRGLDRGQRGVAEDRDGDNAPEIAGLLSELNNAVEELESPVLSNLQVRESSLNGGLGRYLEVKRQLLLVYCQSITFYLLLKSEGQPIRDHPVLARLVDIKALLDKVKELDKELPPEFEESLASRTVQKLQSSDDVELKGAEEQEAIRLRTEQLGSITAAVSGLDDESEEESNRELTMEEILVKKEQAKKYINEDPTDVWWDLENVGVPYDLAENLVHERFLKKLQEEGFLGPVKITAVVGYRNSLPAWKKKKLYEGRMDKKTFKIRIVHDYDRPPNTPKKNQVADENIISRITKWLKKAPKPQNVMIVTGDQGFKDIIMELQAAGHKILVAFKQHPHVTSAKLSKLADYIWFWRFFMSLPKNSISKKIRSAAFVERKRKAAELEKGEASK